MVDKNLSASLKLVFGDEGGYVNVKTDRGGPTKYGITAVTLGAYRNLNRAATASEVSHLSMTEAEAIYRSSYWAQCGANLLPSGLDYSVFDFAVNSGPARAVKVLQQLVGAGVDGTVGAITLQKVNSYAGGVTKLIRDYADARMAFLRTLGGSKGFGPNGRGWTIRVTGVDPKGVFKPTLGVVGNSLVLANGDGDGKPRSTPSNGAKAYKASTGIVGVMKDPEARAFGTAALTTLSAVGVGSGPLQWALAALVVAAVVAGMVLLVRRVRRDD